MKTTAILIALAALVAGCTAGKTNSEPRITSSGPNIFEILAHPHGGGTYKLTINGHKYAHVLGSPPLYLRTNDMIVFVTVTEDRADNGQLHIYDVKTRADTVLSSIDVFLFGMGIGNSARVESEIKSIIGDEMTLVWHSSEIDLVYVISVSTHRLKEHYKLQLDESGKVTNRIERFF